MHIETHLHYRYPYIGRDMHTGTDLHYRYSPRPKKDAVGFTSPRENGTKSVVNPCPAEPGYVLPLVLPFANSVDPDQLASEETN